MGHSRPQAASRSCWKRPRSSIGPGSAPLRSRVGAGKKGQDVAGDAFLAAGFRRRQVCPGLVAVAASGLAFDHGAGPDPGGARLVRAWCLPLADRARRSVLGDRWVSSRPGRCDGGSAGGRPLAGAQQGRRQRPAAAAQGGRDRAGPGAGTGGGTPAGPPAASVPLLPGGMTGGSAGPGPGRAACGPGVAGLHRVTARPGAWPGSLDQAPASSAGTRQCERHGHQRP